jgi:hypothetical protein
VHRRGKYLGTLRVRRRGVASAMTRDSGELSASRPIRRRACHRRGSREWRRPFSPCQHHSTPAVKLLPLGLVAVAPWNATTEYQLPHPVRRASSRQVGRSDVHGNHCGGSGIPPAPTLTQPPDSLSYSDAYGSYCLKHPERFCRFYTYTKVR